MNRPSYDDLLLAAEWLDENEGDADEKEPLARVAEWLRSYVAKHQENGAIREIARRSGASITRSREAYQRTKKAHVSNKSS